MSRIQPSSLYVAAVGLGGCALLALLVITDWSLLRSAKADYWVLAGLVVLGEMLPIKVSRRAEEEEITTSMTFAFALLLSHGITAAVVAQAIASVATDLMRRKPLWKAGFNLGQYTIALAASGGVLIALSNTPNAGGMWRFGLGDLPAIAAAAATFFVANFMLVVVAVAMARRMSILAYLKLDFSFFASSSAVLLAMSPLVVAAADFSLPLIFLLALPLAAVHRSASVSVENAKLVVGLEQSLAQLTEMNRMKDDFVASVSHELRTPLTVIQGFLKTLLRRDVAFSEEDKVSFLEAADRNSERLRRLIEQLLVVARLESQKEAVVSAPVSVDAVARRVVEELHGPADGRPIDFTFGDPFPQVLSDEGKIHQILSNLVENALKYAPAGTPVTVEGTFADGFAVVSVIDRGSGIPGEHRDKIFDRFYQVDSSSTRTVGGTGLGLYICRRLAEEIGGRLWLERSDHRGSVFSLRVPLERPLPGAEPDPGVELEAASALPGAVPALVGPRRRARGGDAA